MNADDFPDGYWWKAYCCNCRFFASFLFLNIPHTLINSNNKQQTTNNKQQTTNNKQQTTNNKQQTTNNKQQRIPRIS